MKRVVILIILPLLVLLQQLSSQWTSDSSLNTKVAPFGMSPLVVSDDNDGAIIFFANVVKTRTYVQRIDKNGYVKWNGSLPVRIGGYLRNQRLISICPDGFGGAYLQYVETDKSIGGDTGRTLIFTNRINSNGKLLWNDTLGINLNHNPSNYDPSLANYYDKIFNEIIPAGTNGYYYAWIDSANGSGLNSATLKFQRLKLDGSKAFGEEGISVTKDIPFQSISDVIGDECSGIFIATSHRIFQYDSTGNRLKPDSGIYIPRYVYFLEMNRKEKKLLCPSIEYVGMTILSNYYLTSLDSIGNVQWERKIMDSINLDIEKPKITISENGNINLFWREKKSDSSYCINYLKVDKSGNIVFNSPKKVIAENVSIGNPEPFLSDSSATILIWGRSGIYYYVLKIDSIGNKIWDQPVLINHRKTVDGFIHVVNQNDKGIIMVWYDLETRSGIYAQNINSNGKLGPLTSIKKNPQGNIAPNAFSFIGNYPNPFNPNTEIIFELPRKGDVAIGIYDIAGREIAKHEQYFADGGRYSFLFNASTFSSGMYLCSITFEGQRITKKMQFIK